MGPNEPPVQETASSASSAPTRSRACPHDGDHREERLRSLRDALRAVRQGDFSVRLPTDRVEDGVLGEVWLSFNALVEQNAALVRELDRVALVVGIEGAITARATLGPVAGAWGRAVDSMNTILESVAWPTVETTRILSAIAAGDLSQTMADHRDGGPRRLHSDHVRAWRECSPEPRGLSGVVRGPGTRRDRARIVP